ncbi:MAG: pentapeptide repeat-containing protein [Gammaproteobacteria bacterium]
MLAFAFQDPIAMAMKYKATADEMTPGARFFRDFRDILILCVVVIGVVMAAWRNASLDRQSESANEQAKAATMQADAANKQAETAANQFALTSERLYSDQFASAAESMSKEDKDGKPLIAARISGIYIMADLAKRTEFAERVVINLIAYIKDNTQRTATATLENGITSDKPRKLGGDVKAAFSALHRILVKKDIADELLDFSQEDFSGLDFQGIDLQHYKKWTEANFSRCYLTKVQFADGADMRWATFSGAILYEATLEGVDLQFATMEKADLAHARMPNAKLDYAYLRGANMASANMRGANLTSASMHGCRMCSAELEQADLTEAHLTGANLEKTKLIRANMDRADLRGAMLFRADLTCAEKLLHIHFGETFMVEAIIDEPYKTDLVNFAKSRGRKIWFNDADCTGTTSNHPDNTNWHLEEYKDGYALAGVLRNYAGAPSPEHLGLAINFMLPGSRLHGEPENIQRQAAKLDLEKLPENTPEEIKAWLKDIKAKYSGQ